MPSPLTLQRLAPRTFAPSSSVIVAIMAGQSNLEGNGTTTFSYTFSRVQTYYKSDYTTTADNGALATLAFNVNNSTGSSQIDTEPEPSIYLGRRFEGVFPNRLITVKVAIGGTGFTNGTGLWASSGALRNALINHYIKPCLSKLQASSLDVWLMPFFWVQGETDCNNSTNANAYQTQLSALLSAVRTAVGVPTLPIVISRINSGIDSVNYPSFGTVQAAQDAIVAGDQNIRILNPDDLALTDGLHYSDQGYETIAIRYFELARQIGCRKWPGDTSVEVTSAPAVTTQSNNSITVGATSGEYGTLYVGVYSNGSSNPGTTAIKNGTGTGYVARNSGSLVYSTAGSVSVSGLSSATTYTIFAFIEDLAGNQSAVQTLSGTTTSSYDPATYWARRWEATDAAVSGVAITSLAPNIGTGTLAPAGTGPDKVTVTGGYTAAQHVKGSSENLFAAYTLTSPIVRVIVARLTDLSGATQLATDGRGSFAAGFAWNSSTNRWRVSYSGGGDGSVADTNWHIFALSLVNATVSRLWVDGGAPNATNTSTIGTAIGGLTMGSNRSNASYCSMEWIEVLEVAGSLNLTELNNAGTYLVSKYSGLGLTWNTATT